MLIGRAVGDLGDMLVPLALVAVTIQIGDISLLGYLLAARAIPNSVFALFGGSWADRFDPRMLMLATDATRALSQGVFASILLSHSLPLGPILLLQAVYGAATGVFNPAANVIVPSIVPESEIQRVNAGLSTRRSLARVLGPVAAGLLLTHVQVGWLLGLDALSFVVSGLAIMTVPQGLRAASIKDRGSWRSEMVSGLSVARAQPWILVCVIYFALFQFFALAPLFVIGPFLIHLSGVPASSAWAYFLTLGGAGFVVGGLVARRLKPPRPLVLCFAISVLDGAQLISLGLKAPYVCTMALGFSAGVVGAIWQVLFTTALQRNVDRSLLGRVWALDEVGSVIAVPVAFALFGLLANHYSHAGLVLFAGCAISIISIGCALLPTVRLPLKGMEDGNVSQ